MAYNSVSQESWEFDYAPHLPDLKNKKNTVKQLYEAAYQCYDISYKKVKTSLKNNYPMQIGITHYSVDGFRNTGNVKKSKISEFINQLKIVDELVTKSQNQQDSNTMQEERKNQLGELREIFSELFSEDGCCTIL